MESTSGGGGSGGNGGFSSVGGAGGLGGAGLDGSGGTGGHPADAKMLLTLPAAAVLVCCSKAEAVEATTDSGFKDGKTMGGSWPPVFH